MVNLASIEAWADRQFAASGPPWDSFRGSKRPSPRTSRYRPLLMLITTTLRERVDLLAHAFACAERRTASDGSIAKQNCNQSYLASHCDAVTVDDEGKRNNPQHDGVAAPDCCGDWKQAVSQNPRARRRRGLQPELLGGE